MKTTISEDAAISIREWLVYFSLMSNSMYNQAFVDWSLQAAIYRKRVDDHIAARVAALGPSAPTRREIIDALHAGTVRQIPHSDILANDICL